MKFSIKLAIKFSVKRLKPKLDRPIVYANLSSKDKFMSYFQDLIKINLIHIVFWLPEGILVPHFRQYFYTA